MASLLLVAALGAGCTTIYGETGMEEEARAEMELANLKAQVDRLQSRVSEMDEERQDVHRRLDALEGGMQTVQRDSQERIRTLEGTMATYDATRQRDRDAVVDQLSKKMAEMVKPAPGGATRVAEGYEHVVQPGETLSAIASAYGVKSSTIIQVNNLKNPDNLRAGQKLFIPE